MSDLGLIWSILSIPTRILQHIAADDRRCDSAIVADTYIVFVEFVFECFLFQLLEIVVLALSLRQGERCTAHDTGRHGLADQLNYGFETDDSEHFCGLMSIGAYVAILKDVSGL